MVPFFSLVILVLISIMYSFTYTSALNHLGPSHLFADISAAVISAPPTLRPLVISVPETFWPQLYFRFLCIFLCYIVIDASSIKTVLKCIMRLFFFYNHLMYTAILRTKSSYYHIVIWVLQNSNIIIFIYLFIYLFN